VDCGKMRQNKEQKGLTLSWAQDNSIFFEGGFMKKKAGFTLIELLVVIAIIALLLAILVPALRIAKMKATAVLCMTNSKNLSLGWYMYQEDNDGWLMSAENSGKDRNGRRIGWIWAPIDQTGRELSETSDILLTSPPVTDEDEIRGIQKGALFPYIKDPQAYHCVGDKIRKSAYDGTKVYVSYTMARCLNGSSGGVFRKIAKRFGEISSPSQKYNFIETAEIRNWNWGAMFQLKPPYFSTTGAWEWWGTVAINHGDSSILGFCDGHAEKRRWVDPSTKERVEALMLQSAGGWYGNLPDRPADQIEDIGFMSRGWTEAR